MFTPFFRAWQEHPVLAVADPEYTKVTANGGSESLDESSSPELAGEEGAGWRLGQYLERIAGNQGGRDRPDQDATSRLSIDLKYGTISPVTIYQAMTNAGKVGAEVIRQLAWRDFFGQLMAEFPRTATGSLYEQYDTIEWRNDPEEISAWKQGLTGYPFVDAGMRELLAEGWIHNRVRMVVASFLVKDLLVDWRIGERHLRRQLLDGDVAQNVGNWQWVAGTGADAAPYFRVFNPVTQSKRFDPDGNYIRQWVPELAGLDSDTVHAPWEAGPLELAAAGIELGVDYPEPLVEHSFARTRAIAAYEAARRGVS